MPQLARPIADTLNPGGWTDQAGGTVNLYQAIDEATADDADFVRSPLAPASAVYVTQLGALEDPQTSAGHSLRVRYAKDVAAGAQINLTVELRQGYVNEGSPGTLIATRTFTDIGAGFATDAYALSAAEADAITDYSAIFLRFVATQV